MFGRGYPPSYLPARSSIVKGEHVVVIRSMVHATGLTLKSQVIIMNNVFLNSKACEKLNSNTILQQYNFMKILMKQ